MKSDLMVWSSYVSTNETKFYPGFQDLDQDVNCHILTFYFQLRIGSHVLYGKSLLIS